MTTLPSRSCDLLGPVLARSWLCYGSESRRRFFFSSQWIRNLRPWQHRRLFASSTTPQGHVILITACFFIELRQLLHKDFIELLCSNDRACNLVWVDQTLVGSLIIDQFLIELMWWIPLIQKVSTQSLLEPYKLILSDSITDHVFQLILVASAVHFVVVTEEACVAVVDYQGVLGVAVLYRWGEGRTQWACAGWNLDTWAECADVCWSCSAE